MDRLWEVCENGRWGGHGLRIIARSDVLSLASMRMPYIFGEIYFLSELLF